MAKDIKELIEIGEKLERSIDYDIDENDYVDGLLPEVEYATWKAECATYLEKEYKGNETTKIFLKEFSNAGVGNVQKYKELLGYLHGMYNNEVDGIIKPKSKTKLVFMN